MRTVATIAAASVSARDVRFGGGTWGADGHDGGCGGNAQLSKLPTGGPLSLIDNHGASPVLSIALHFSDCQC